MYAYIQTSNAEAAAKAACASEARTAKSAPPASSRNSWDWGLGFRVYTAFLIIFKNHSKYLNHLKQSQ